MFLSVIPQLHALFCHSLHYAIRTAWELESGNDASNCICRVGTEFDVEMEFKGVNNLLSLLIVLTATGIISSLQSMLEILVSTPL